MSIVDTSGLFNTIYSARSYSAPSTPSRPSDATTQYDKNAPWSPSAPKINESAELKRVMAAKSVFDNDAVKIKAMKMSKESDAKKLFALHKAMNRVNIIAKEAAKTTVSDSQRANYEKRFKAGMKEIDEYMTGLSLSNADLIKGLRNNVLETRDLKQISGIMSGDSFEVSSADMEVSQFENAAPFDITLTNATKTATINIDLSKMGETPRTLNNVADFINGEIAKEGFSSHLNVSKTFNNATFTYQYGLSLAKTTGEEIVLPQGTGEPSATGGNLLKNTEFDQNSAVIWTDSVSAPNYVLNGVSSTDFWTTSDIAEVWHSVDNTRSGFFDTDAVLGIDAYSQSIQTIVGKTYNLEFDWAGHTENNNATTREMEVVWNGAVVQTLAPTDMAVWRGNKISLVGSGGTDTLTIREKAGSGLNDHVGTWVDNIRLTEAIEQTAFVPQLGANLVQNGSFENTNGVTNWFNNSSNMTGTEVRGQMGDLANWTNPTATQFSGGSDLIRGKNGAQIGTDGNVIVELDGQPGSQADALVQSVQTEAGKNYQLSFDISHYNNVAFNTSGVEVLWNGQIVGLAYPDTNDGIWRNITVSVTGTGGMDQLQLRELASENESGGALIDNVKLQEIQNLDQLMPNTDAPTRKYGANLISDGGFENLAVNIFSPLVPTSTAWQSNNGYAEVWSQGYEMGGPQFANGHFIELDHANAVDAIRQTVVTEAGALYQFDFSHAIRNLDNSGGAVTPIDVSNTMEVVWNGKVMGTITATPDGKWNSSRFDLIGTGGNDVIEIRETAIGNDYHGPFLDNMQLRKVISDSPSNASGSGIDLLNIGQNAWNQEGSNRLVDLAGVKAGDSFKIKVDDKKIETIKITDTMTLSQLASKLSSLIGTAAGTAKVKSTGLSQKIVLDPKLRHRIEIIASDIKVSALDELGLNEGVARKLVTGKDLKKSPAPKTGINSKEIAAIEFKTDYSIDTKLHAKDATTALEGMMRRVRLAYKTDMGVLKPSATGTPAPQISAADAAKINMYKQALARLSG